MVIKSNIDLSKYDKQEKYLYDGVLIIPIRNDKPVLIFKKFCAPFYTDEWFPGENGGSIVFDYRVYWKDRYYNHEFPDTLKEYAPYILEFIRDKIPTYIGFMYKGWQEFKIEDFRNLDFSKCDEYSYLRNTFEKLGFLPNLMGKDKPSNKRETQLRRDVIEKILLKGLKKNKRLSVKETHNEWVRISSNKSYPEEWDRKRSQIYRDMKYVLDPKNLLRSFVKKEIKKRLKGNLDINSSILYELWTNEIVHLHLDPSKYNQTKKDVFLCIAQGKPLSNS